MWVCVWGVCVCDFFFRMLIFPRNLMGSQPKASDIPDLFTLENDPSGTTYSNRFFIRTPFCSHIASTVNRQFHIFGWYKSICAGVHTLCKHHTVLTLQTDTTPRFTFLYPTRVSFCDRRQGKSGRLTHSRFSPYVIGIPYMSARAGS